VRKICTLGLIEAGGWRPAYDAASAALPREHQIAESTAPCAPVLDLLMIIGVDYHRAFRRLRFFMEETG